MSHWNVQPGRAGSRRVRVPGDKSVSHRALLFNALAEGEATVRGLLRAEDVGRTWALCEQLGATIHDGESVRVRGGRVRDVGEVNCGNSGTTARLALGALAGRAAGLLLGDASLSRRPMRRVTEPLRMMGADIDVHPTLPISVRCARLRGADIVSPLASAQVKTAVILAALVAEGETRFVEPSVSRDHSERLLRAMGARLDGVSDTGLVVRQGPLVAQDVVVPGDVSSAAFWAVATAILGGEVVLEGVGLNPTRTGVFDVLRAMGAEVEVLSQAGADPVGDVRVRANGLRGALIAGALIPRLVDEIPVLAVAAAFADGETQIRDAQELRVKESDRIETVAAGLRAMGVGVEVLPDGLVVTGGGAREAGVSSAGDHRVAMAFAVAGLRVGMHVDDVDCVATSYPGFAAELARWQA